MTVGDLIAVDYQIELNGLLLGADTAYDLAEAPDGTGVPDVKADDEQRPLTHGVVMGRDLMGGRKRAFKVWVFGTSPADAMAKIDVLVGAWAPTDTTQTLVWRLPGTTRIEFGRPRKCDIDLKWLPQATASASLQWVASDPRQYAAAQSSATTGPRFTTGGRTYPKTYPKTYGASSAGSGSVICDNFGNVASYPTCRVEGATGAPIRLVNSTTDRTLEIPVLLAADQSLTIDMAARTIVRENGLPMFLPAADWWPLEPGSNEVSFIAGGLSTSLLTITWRSAWI